MAHTIKDAPDEGRFLVSVASPHHIEDDGFYWGEVFELGMRVVREVFVDGGIDVLVLHY